MFFFSSRRRHTRCYRDWSSDVCSSDLKKMDERRTIEKETDAALEFLSHLHKRFGSWYLAAAAYDSGENRIAHIMKHRLGHEKGRSEERRVGKECRCGEGSEE